LQTLNILLLHCWGTVCDISSLCQFHQCWKCQGNSETVNSVGCALLLTHTTAVFQLIVFKNAINNVSCYLCHHLTEYDFPSVGRV